MNLAWLRGGEGMYHCMNTKKGERKERKSNYYCRKGSKEGTKKKQLSVFTCLFVGKGGALLYTQGQAGGTTNINSSKGLPHLFEKEALHRRATAVRSSKKHTTPPRQTQTRTHARRPDRHANRPTAHTRGTQRESHIVLKKIRRSYTNERNT